MTKRRIVVLSALALTLLAAPACERSLSGARCPCVAGWVCCSADNACHPASSGCPGGDAGPISSEGGGGAGDAGTGSAGQDGSIATTPTVFPRYCSVDGWCGATPAFSGVWGSADDDVWVVAKGLDDSPTRSALLHFDGSTWTSSVWNVPPPAMLGGTVQAIWGSGPRDVLAVGLAGLVLRFDGDAWTPEPLTLNRDLYSVAGTSARDVWAVGARGGIQQFDGAAWSVFATNTDADLAGVWALDAADAWAVGAAGTLLHWDGTRWSRYADAFGGTPTTKDLRAVWGSSHDSVWAAGDAGTVLHFDGSTWTTAGYAVPTTADLRAIWGSDRDNVWVAGAGGALVHWTGAAWFSVATATDQALNAVWGGASGAFWIVGDASTSVHWKAPGWATSPPPLFPATAGLRVVGGSGDDDVWIAGTHGALTHWNGASWLVAPVGGTEWDFTGVWALRRDHAFLTSIGGGIIGCRPVEDKPCGNGLEWSYGSNMRGIWGSADDDIWAVGDAGAVQHWDGTNWSAVAVPTTEDVTSIWGFAPDDVWATLSADAALHWNGVTWSLVDSLTGSNTDFTTWRWYSVFGTSPDDIWLGGAYTISSYMAAAGASGTSHWNGSAWSTQPGGPVVPIAASPGAAGQVWITGTLPLVSRWDGAAWNRSFTGSSLALFGIWARDPDDIWAVGDGGTILRRQVTGP